MPFNTPEMPQHLVLALDHHNQLLDEAHRQRQARAARQAALERPVRWRRLCSHVGDLLITFGQQLKTAGEDGAMDHAAARAGAHAAEHATDTVWR